MAEDLSYDYEGLPEGTPLSASILAGGFAGIMEHTVMYPLDALKVSPVGLRQSNYNKSSNKSQTRMQLLGTGKGASTISTGVMGAIARISSTEGARSLWRGISSVALGAGPAHAVYFSVYEVTKSYLSNVNNKNSSILRSDTFNDDLQKEYHPVAIAVAGACATISSDALMNPFDVIKQRMQMAGSKFRTVGECAMTLYRVEGIKAFYVSYPTTLTMSVPLTAINFSVYEALQKIVNPTKNYDPLTHCIAGGLAGGTASAATNPLDVIKTLLQTRGSSPDAEIRQANGLVAATRIIYQREGMWGFMRGVKPRILTNIPSTAICWTAYEMAKYYIISVPQTRTQRI